MPHERNDVGEDRRVDRRDDEEDEMGISRERSQDMDMEEKEMEMESSNDGDDGLVETEEEEEEVDSDTETQRIGDSVLRFARYALVGGSNFPIGSLAHQRSSPP
jgi:hypothetical protein